MPVQSVTYKPHLPQESTPSKQILALFKCGSETASQTLSLKSEQEYVLLRGEGNRQASTGSTTN